MVSLLEYPTAMSSQQNADASQFDWGKLINPDKSPSPLFEQLCLGVADFISKLKTPSATQGLTPERLAAFYRAVGGNYDTLFLSTPHGSLSFIYKSLGCFHVLQPTVNAFEPPTIPTLLPLGFSRWQTIQVLLCPDEHAAYLQEALSRFDIVNPSNGAPFPKFIPRTAFPSEPDPEMVDWHETVGKRLEHEYKASKIREASRSRPCQREAESPTAQSRSPSRPPVQSHHLNQPALRPKPSLSSRGRSRDARDARSPYSRPLNRSEPTESGDSSDMDGDPVQTRAPKFYYVNSDDDSEPQFHSRRPSRPSSRHGRNRGRSRASSRRRAHSRRGGTVDKLFVDDHDGSRGREPSARLSHGHYHPKPSRSADGRRLNSRLLPPEPTRRNSDNTAYLNRNTAATRSIPSFHRPQLSPHHSRQDRIQVEILTTDTEAETETETDLELIASPTRPRLPARGREFHRGGYDDDYDDEDDEDEEDEDDFDDEEIGLKHRDQYSPESKHARDFYQTPNPRSRHHHNARHQSSPTSLQHQHQHQPHQYSHPLRNRRSETEHIVLPTATIPTASIPTSSPSSAPRKRYKEYILVDSDGRRISASSLSSASASASASASTPTSATTSTSASSASTAASPTATHYARRPSRTRRSRSRSRYRQTPITITTTASGSSGSGNISPPGARGPSGAPPSLSQRRSFKTLDSRRPSATPNDYYTHPHHQWR